MKTNKTFRKIAAVSLATLVAVTGPVAAGIVTNQSVLAQESSYNHEAFITAAGAEESVYATWHAEAGVQGYVAYVKKDGSYQKVDSELVRLYEDNIYRVDVPGLAAGEYTLKIVPVKNNQEQSAKAFTAEKLQVVNYDRTGFAWVNGTSNGAYNQDGTLMSDAVVLYIHEGNKDSVTLEVVKDNKGNKQLCTGIVEILSIFKKGYDSRPLDIRVLGKVTNAGQLKSNSDCKGDLVISGSSSTKRIGKITLEGIGDDAVAYGWGVRVKNASNVEIRNLGFMMCNSDEGDDVGLQQDNDHIWVHDCDMFYGCAGGDSDQAKGDGALDCKLSTYVTFSYNHFWDTGKSNLLGLKEKTTEGYYITYHHNWYDHSDSRHPRVRYYSAHVYNNYYDGNAKYGVGATLGSSVFVEGNYFRNVPYPIMTSMQGSDVFAGGIKRDVANNATFSKENGGTIKVFNNVMTGAYTFIPYGAETYVCKGEEKTFDLNGTNSKADFDGVVVASADEVISSSIVSYSGNNTYNNFDTSSVMYSYKADAVEDVPAIVTKKAGRLNSGDFTFTFNNEVDDADYGVNASLMAALRAYESKLVSVGTEIGQGEEETTTEAPTEETTTEAPTEETTTEAPTEETTTEATTEETTTAAPIQSGTIVHNFTVNGLKSDFFTISGNLSSSKGTVAYDGLELTTCLKIETSTKITFNMPKDGTLTLVFNPTFAKTIKIDGEKNTVSAGILTVDLSAGEHTITKGDTCNLYYMVVAMPEETTTEEETTTVEETTTEEETTAEEVKKLPFEERDGQLYYVVDGKVVRGAGLIEVNGKYYYVMWNGVVVRNNMSYKIEKTNGYDVVPGKHYIDENGVVSTATELKEIDGKTYAYVDGILQRGVGVVEIGGKLYYAMWDGTIVKNNMSYKVEKTNGYDVVAGNHFIDGEGVISTETVIRDVDGVEYLYIDGVIMRGAGLVCVDGKFYYAMWNGAIVKNNSHYLVANTSHASVADAGIEKGYYAFDADGVMIR